MDKDHKEQIRNLFNQLAQDYLVEDIIPDQATFLFLLESPHVQELKYGAPVSGSSGVSMTKHLFGEQYEKDPLGILVKKNRDEALNRPSINQVALMNVCQIPMQGAAYKDPQIREHFAPFFERLEYVRTQNTRDVFAKEELNAVQDVIIESLRRKLEKLTDRHLFVVPCGKFAQKFFRLAAVNSPQWTVLEGVPHPSYNGWSKSEYGAAVGRLLAEFQK